MQDARPSSVKIPTDIRWSLMVMNHCDLCKQLQGPPNTLPERNGNSTMLDLCTCTVQSDTQAGEQKRNSLPMNYNNVVQSRHNMKINAGIHLQFVYLICVELMQEELKL